MSNTLQFSGGLQIKRGDVTETGTLSGYASVFNQIDQGGDRVAPGAYTKTLREWSKRGKLPPMLLQHGGFLGPAEDSIPVGIWESMKEDGKGLAVSGRLFALDTQKGRYIHEGLRAGSLDGLSIGYVAREVAYGKDPKEPRRTLKQIELKEISIVTFPMDLSARVDAAKAASSARDLEDTLRQIGFSQRDAKRIVAGGWSALSRNEQPSELSQAVKLLNQSTAAITKGINHHGN